MALEATGLAVGLVPLGLQLVREVTGYLEGIERREFEVDAAGIQLSILESTLSSIDAEVLAVGPIAAETKTAVDRSCKLVRQQIEHISAFVKSLKLDGGGSGSRTDRAKSKARELVYPFKRESLKDLQTQLRDVNGTLSMALRPFDYHVHRQLHAQSAAATAQKFENLMLEMIRLKEATPNLYNVVETAVSLSSQPAALEEIASGAGVTTSHVAETTSAILSHVRNPIMLKNKHRKLGTGLCSCRPTLRQRRNYRDIGALSLVFEEKEQAIHGGDCIYRAAEPSSSERTYSIGWKVNTCRSYVSTVLALALNFSVGGSRSRFVPFEIQTYNRIDLDRSPMARLTLMGGYSYDMARDFHFSEKSKTAIWGHLRDQTIRLFQEGKASPRDVDYADGRSILHTAINELWLVEAIGSIADLFPKDIANSDGCTALDDYILSSGTVQYQNALYLYPKPGPLSPALVRGLNVPRQVWNMLHAMEQVPELIEDAELGPMCRAILSRSMKDVLQELRRNCHAPQEPFIEATRPNGPRAFDLAALWFPESVTAMARELDQGAGTVFHLQTLADASSWDILSSLSVGLQGSSSSGSPTEHYVGAIEIVLHLDRPILWDLEIAAATSSFPVGILTTVALGLADRRRRLYQFAKTHLPEVELEQFCCPISGLLDQHAREVLEMLESRLQVVPEYLRPSSATWRSGVYTYVTSSIAADALYHAGFRPDDFVLAYLGEAHPRHQGRITMMALPDWLILHCDTTTLMTPLTANQGPSKYVGHRLAGKFGYGYYDGYEAPSSHVPALKRIISLNHIVDSCECACSSTGCTPLGSFLRVFCLLGDVDLRKNHALKQYRRLASDIDRLTEPDRVSCDVAMTVAIAFAFIPLGCRHTCCYLDEREDLPTLMDVDEREEIWLEDWAALDALQRLQMELRSVWIDSDCSLSEFVDSHLWPAVTAAWREMQTPTADQDSVLCEMRQLGIRTEVEPESETESASSRGSKSDIWDSKPDVDDPKRARWEEAMVNRMKRDMDKACGWD